MGRQIVREKKGIDGVDCFHILNNDLAMTRGLSIYSEKDGWAGIVYMVDFRIPWCAISLIFADIRNDNHYLCSIKPEAVWKAGP